MANLFSRGLSDPTPPLPHRNRSRRNSCKPCLLPPKSLLSILPLPQRVNLGAKKGESPRTPWLWPVIKPCPGPQGSQGLRLRAGGGWKTWLQQQVPLLHAHHGSSSELPCITHFLHLLRAKAFFCGPGFDEHPPLLPGHTLPTQAQFPATFLCFTVTFGPLIRPHLSLGGLGKETHPPHSLLFPWCRWCSVKESLTCTLGWVLGWERGPREVA